MEMIENKLGKGRQGLIENNLGKGGRDRKQIGRTMRI